MTAVIPPPTSPAWKRVLTGEKLIASSHVGFNMLVVNCKLRLRRDPSPENLTRTCVQAHAFFEKYASTLSDEIRQLQQ